MKIKEIITEGPFADADQEHQEDYPAVWANNVVDSGLWDPIEAPEDSDKLNRKYDVLGSGVEAVVIKDPTNPSVVKIHGGLQEIKQSGYMQFILLSRKYAATNPFLPKIINIKKITVPEYAQEIQFMLSIQMERLIPLSKLTESQIGKMLTNMFTNRQYDEVKAYEVEQILYELVSKPTPNMPKPRSPNLTNVMKLIKLIQKRTGAEYDLHEGNMMIRMSGDTPQLVITDPVN